MQRRPEVWANGERLGRFPHQIPVQHPEHMYPHKTATSAVVVANTTPTHCVPPAAEHPQPENRGQPGYLMMGGPSEGPRAGVVHITQRVAQEAETLCASAGGLQIRWRLGCLLA